jgi:transforming growth factor beta, invertebrate
MADREELPTEVEESTLSVFLTNSPPSYAVDKKWKADQHVNDSESDYDDNNSNSDSATKKLTLKSNRNRRKSHSHHHRHQNNNRNRIQIITNKQMIRLHVYESNAQGRVFLFSKDITLPINSDDKKFTYNKWIQLDLTSTVSKWLQETEPSLSIDIYCESCSKYGLQIVNNQDANEDESKNNPTLNIVGSVVRTKRKTGHRKHGQLDEAKDYTITKPKKTFCRQDGDKKCCRHKWEIDFKELGGYDYIIQPRVFDAGFCDGSCPYKFNVANNHAFFQSMARHQLKNSNVPNVCCAPTRLVDMEVLHIDENDHTRLKVTTMQKMRVMKCSCT